MKLTLHMDEALPQRIIGIYGCDSKTAVDFALREMERRHMLAPYAHRGLGLEPSELVNAINPG